MSRPFTGEPIRVCAIDCPGLAEVLRVEPSPGFRGDRAATTTDTGGRPNRRRPRVPSTSRVPGGKFEHPPVTEEEPLPWGDTR